MTLDRDALASELALRVFGDTVIQHVAVANRSAPEDWSNVVVAGSDGSTYSSVMSIDTARAFVDEGGSEVVTFNNSIVYLHMEGLNRERHTSQVYSVPITRSAIDSPTNAGMVMAPFMYRDLSEGEYEHMAKCATDVVQWRADERVFIGDAPALGGDGRRLPSPRVHLRDGTVTLQERESHHYQRNDAYGDMVRAGVLLSWQILAHIKSRKQPPVFAGAVKGSQLHLFSTIINWFIAHGHPASGMRPVDPAWDITRASLLADNETVTMLLATLAADRGDGYFCTFAVSRPFHALTDMARDYDARGRRRVGRQAARPAERPPRQADDGQLLEDRRLHRGRPVRPHVRGSRLRHVLHRPHRRGPAAAGSAVRVPRVPPARRSGSGRGARVRRNIELLVAALDHTKFTVDTDHNFLTGKRLVKIVPAVVYRAHEYCKALGRRLETELKSMIVANLHRLGMARRASDDAVSLRPLNARRFFEQQARLHDAAPREIGKPDQPNEDDG